MVYLCNYLWYKMNAWIHIICIFHDHLFFLLQITVLLLLIVIISPHFLNKKDAKLCNHS